MRPTIRPHSRSHGAVAIIAMLALIDAFGSGCREYPTAVSAVTPAGRGIMGTVTDRFRNPVARLPVALYYTFDLLDLSGAPDTSCIVPAGFPTVVVSLYAQDSTFKRIVYRGNPAPGPFSVQWDGTDSTGAAMANGIYTIQYRVQDTLRLTVTQLRNGCEAARTDSLGRYVITRDLQAIGHGPVPVYSSYNGSFLGWYAIGAEVDLDFASSVSEAVRAVYPGSEQYTRVDVTLE